jgi:hypothetical protein
VKHAVVALDVADGREGHRIIGIKLHVLGRQVAARIVDAGDVNELPRSWTRPGSHQITQSEK